MDETLESRLSNVKRKRVSICYERAEAAGIEVDETRQAIADSMGISDDAVFTKDGKTWNSYASNDDCFRLETALRITFDWCDHWELPHVKAIIGASYITEYYADHNGHKDKARRYASTRAAALRYRSKELEEGRE